MQWKITSREKNVLEYRLGNYLMYGSSSYVDDYIKEVVENLLVECVIKLLIKVMAFLILEKMFNYQRTRKENVIIGAISKIDV